MGCMDKNYCTYCGKRIKNAAGDDSGGSWCNGMLEWGEDPFAADVHDDHTKVWMCSGTRYEHAMDI